MAARSKVSAGVAATWPCRFGVAFNCPPEIPYFPVAHPGQRAGFAIGTENSALLFEAFNAAVRCLGPPTSPPASDVSTFPPDTSHLALMQQRPEWQICGGAAGHSPQYSRCAPGFCSPVVPRLLGWVPCRNNEGTPQPAKAQHPARLN